MKINFYNRLVSEDIVDFLNAETEYITTENKHIVLQLDENSWMSYKYDDVDMMEADMEEIMAMRMSLSK